jgi:excisionase family DNA binding protein
MQQITDAPIAPEYLRVRAAAQFLNISSPHLQALLRRGEAPPSTRLGRARLFSVHSLREFMRQREQ